MSQAQNQQKQPQNNIQKDESQQKNINEQKQIKSEQKDKDKYKDLEHNIDSLTKNLQKRLAARKQKKIKKRQELNDLFDNIQESSNVIVAKIEDLNRKPTIIITIAKVMPQIPEGFPKNYNVQLTYEDVAVTGNQKFTDFDQNNIQDKLIVPLLSSETARIEIWTAQQQPVVYDKTILNLEQAIQEAIQNPGFQAELSLQQNPQTTLTYSVQIQGVGFSAWLKNLKSIRQAEQERSEAIKQARLKAERNRQRLEQKKQKFNEKFRVFQQRSTKQYKVNGIDDILDNLDSD